MDEIKNIKLKFHCPETRDSLKPKQGEFFCDKCDKKVIDFTTKSKEELNIVKSENPHGVCGIFKKHQMNRQFLKYAAAATLATTTFVTDSKAQEVVENEDGEEIELTGIEIEDVPFTGEVVMGDIEMMPLARPVGGVMAFIKAVNNELLLPPELDSSGKVFFSVKVDSAGLVKEYKILKSYDLEAGNAVLKALKKVNYPFLPANRDEIPISSELIMPIIIDIK